MQASRIVGVHTRDSVVCRCKWSVVHMPTIDKCAAFGARIGSAGPDARRVGRLRSSPWSPSSTTDVSADLFLLSHAFQAFVNYPVCAWRCPATSPLPACFCFVFHAFLATTHVLSNHKATDRWQLKRKKKRWMWALNSILVWFVTSTSYTYQLMAY
jgi:hypothetical protein